jgi:hypothetical protein
MIHKTVYGIIGTNCYYYVKDILNDGTPILRPPTEEETMTDSGKYFDMTFYSDDLSKVKGIVDHAKKLAKEERSTSVYVPYLILKEHLADLEIVSMHLSLSQIVETMK